MYSAFYNQMFEKAMADQKQREKELLKKLQVQKYVKQMNDLQKIYNKLNPHRTGQESI